MKTVIIMIIIIIIIIITITIILLGFPFRKQSNKVATTS